MDVLLKDLKPVPAGIKRPRITFSFNPRNHSTFPSTAACVKIRVVSWKLAAEIKLSVINETLVMPSKTGSYSINDELVERRARLI